MTFHIGTPHTRGSGYFINDQNLSTRQEADIQTCPHCQAVIKLQEWRTAPEQNFCLKCMKPACNNEACQPCIPFIRRIEQAMAAQMRFQKLTGPSAPVTPSVSIYTG